MCAGASAWAATSSCLKSVASRKTPRRGQAIAKRRGEIFKHEFLPKLKPFKGAGELVAAIRERGLTVVAASSASKEDLKALLKVAGVEDLMDEEDVQRRCREFET